MPLKFMPRFTEALRASCGPDGGPNVWVKRDDMLGLTVLEYGKAKQQPI